MKLIIKMGNAVTMVDEMKKDTSLHLYRSSCFRSAVFAPAIFAPAQNRSAVFAPATFAPAIFALTKSIAVEHSKWTVE